MLVWNRIVVVAGVLQFARSQVFIGFFCFVVDEFDE